jgi:hypothetical protein
VLRLAGVVETPALAGFSRCDARNAALEDILKAEGVKIAVNIGSQAGVVSKIAAHD